MTFTLCRAVAIMGEGGCNNPPFIEFCSVKCFEDLERRMADGKKNFQKCWNYWGDR